MRDLAERLAGGVCVITGVAGGAGRAAADRLAQEGATVVGARFGRIDVLFNNAGINDPEDGRR